MSAEITFLLVGLCAGALLGFIIGWLMQKNKSGSVAGTPEGFAELKTRYDLLEKEKNNLHGEKMKLEGSVEKSREVFSEQYSKLLKAEAENKELASKLATAETQSKQIEHRIKETRTEMNDLK